MGKKVEKDAKKVEKVKSKERSKHGKARTREEKAPRKEHKKKHSRHGEETAAAAHVQAEVQLQAAVAEIAELRRQLEQQKSARTLQRPPHPLARHLGQNPKNLNRQVRKGAYGM